MKIRGNILSFFLMLIVLQTVFCKTFAQLKRVRVEKTTCWHERDQIQGYKLLVVMEYNDSTIKILDDYYDLEKLASLSDSIKLAIVGQLLQFNGDLSICCRKVYRYYYEPYERVCVGRPGSQTYPISIDALYMINKIVRPYGISFYSCFPVVIDWKTKKELNDCPDLIADYYKIYEECYKEAVRAEKIGDGFQFNTTKYAWYGAIEDTVREWIE
ncbi:hypothetical protein [Chitinophaga sancti]|uniref:Uncharacterized protein n=1 Tax=Chitinophaga sancti TaxID=1004 RepID=A0A1K1SR61_9BACT|nr:hypothetical protein [Chitinophaga sancti]WQD65345.1 hypothetical protein U0033_13165 [Chitinophaga sancti]WQG89031.1 hypothetical protein SR876_29305 [Chitinophaga sancti]SFW86786.1 hypothetical protein SAMN05661012_05960 [Chitinophaga sancti]